MRCSKQAEEKKQGKRCWNGVVLVVGVVLEMQSSVSECWGNSGNRYGSPAQGEWEVAGWSPGHHPLLGLHHKSVHTHTTHNTIQYTHTTHNTIQYTHTTHNTVHNTVHSYNTQHYTVHSYNIQHNTLNSTTINNIQHSTHKTQQHIINATYVIHITHITLNQQSTLCLL